jgi:hypothetical protein
MNATLKKLPTDDETATDVTENPPGALNDDVGACVAVLVDDTGAVGEPPQRAAATARTAASSAREHRVFIAPPWIHGALHRDASSHNQANLS